MNSRANAAAPKRRNGRIGVLHLLTWALLIVAAFTVYYSLQGWKRADGDIEAYAKTLAQGAFQIPLKEGAAPVPQNTVRAAMPNAGANNDQNEGKELQAMLRAASQLTDEYEASKQKFEQWRGQTAKIVGEYHDIPGSYWRGRFGDTVALTPVPGATSAGPKRPEGLENRVQDEVRQLSQKAETSATFKYRMPWQVLSIFGAIVRQGNSFAVVVLEPKIFKWPYLLSDQRMFALLFSILALLGVGALNRYCIRPVQDLAARTEKLAIGRDLLPPGNVGPLAELNRLQDAIGDLAQQSRDSLQKMKELRTDELNRRAIERARLANKLHGGPLAFIKGLSSWSKVFEMYLEKVPADVEQIDSTLKYLWSESDKAEAETRSYIYEYYAPKWSGLNLSQMLTALAAELNEQHAAKSRESADRKQKCVTSSVTGNVDVFEPGTVLELGIQIREAANNAFAHRSGNADNVYISARRETCSDGIDMVTLTVHDDGVGLASSITKQAERNDKKGCLMKAKLAEILRPDGTIDVAKLHEAGHYGLYGIVKTAEYLEGGASVVSKPGEGTTITMRIPVPEKRAEEQTN